jgi:CRISPR-associated protein Cas6/Cse3/CasE subtype I-E
MYITELSIIDGDNYKQHQYIRKIFQGDQKVLFQKTDSCIIVLSSNKSNKECKEVDLSNYNNIDSYTFSIRLNPSKRDNKSKKRVAIDIQNTKKWIREKLEKNGIEANFQYIPEGINRSKKENKTISLNSVLCFGSLKIKDFNLFSNAVLNGIGNAKGLGFGLLNIFF